MTLDCRFQACDHSSPCPRLLSFHRHDAGTHHAGTRDAGTQLQGGLLASTRVLPGFRLRPGPARADAGGAVQGMNRVQSAPRIGRAMHDVLSRVQARFGSWVGLRSHPAPAPGPRCCMPHPPQVLWSARPHAPPSLGHESPAELVPHRASRAVASGTCAHRACTACDAGSSKSSSTHDAQKAEIGPMLNKIWFMIFGGLEH